MAGSSLSGPHPTIANLNVILTDVASNSSLILLASCTGTLDTTTNVYQKGCILYATDVAAGTSGTYMNIGSSTTPSWSAIDGNAGAGGVTYLTDNSNGANNAPCASLFSSGTTKVTLVTGLMVALKLAHTLQAGANTFNLNGTTKSIFAATNAGIGSNLHTPYAVGSVITLVYTPGVSTSGCWQAVGHSG